MGKVRDHVVMTVRKLGGVHWPNIASGMGHRGVADITAVLPGGHVWFLEVKEEGDRESKLQRKLRIKLNSLDANAIYIDPKNYKELEDILNAKRL